jgi:hypothetical protein
MVNLEHMSEHPGYTYPQAHTKTSESLSLACSNFETPNYQKGQAYLSILSVFKIAAQREQG